MKPWKSARNEPSVELEGGAHFEYPILYSFCQGIPYRYGYARAASGGREQAAPRTSSATSLRLIDIVDVVRGSLIVHRAREREP
jgi:hypothetical protein